MLPRLSIALGLVCLAVLCFAVPTACSSSQRRDQNYGSDIGSDYQPEAGVFSDGGDGDAEAGGDAVDSSDRLLFPETLAPDGLVAPDALVLPDTLVRTDTPVTIDVPVGTNAPADAAIDAVPATETDAIP